jgi:hypothetical protein
LVFAINNRLEPKEAIMTSILITYGGSVEHEFEVESIKIDGVDVEDVNVIIGRLPEDEE